MNIGVKFNEQEMKNFIEFAANKEYA